jgi:hypothetical protein
VKTIAFVVWTMVVTTLGTACDSSTPESTGGASGVAQGGAGGGGGWGATGGGAAGGGATGGATAMGSAVGDACDPDTQCPAGGSGTATCLTDWPGGYCAVTGCAPHGHDCPNDSGLGGTGTAGGKCVLAPAETCLALCAVDADCRAGYACVDKDDAANHDPVKVCFPKAS